MYDADVADAVRIKYGGSMNEKNATALVAEKFAAIIKSAKQIVIIIKNGHRTVPILTIGLPRQTWLYTNNNINATTSTIRKLLLTNQPIYSI